MLDTSVRSLFLAVYDANRVQNICVYIVYVRHSKFNGHFTDVCTLFMLLKRKPRKILSETTEKNFPHRVVCTPEIQHTR